MTAISITPALDADAHLDWFDNTKLTAINTCPTWGIIRYGLGRTPSSPSRAMPLEAGHACHEVFAGVRLFDALTSGVIQESVFLHHGMRLFGSERLRTATEAWDHVQREQMRDQQMAFCLSLLDTSGFYDDPNDTRRTVANLEAACIRYIDQWRWGKDPIWVERVNDPDRIPQIGIELPFNYVVHHDVPGLPSFRFTGKIDAIHEPDGRVRLHENKTAGRLDDAWEQSFMMSHQVTGYMLPAGHITGQEIHNATILGLALPQPRNDISKGLMRVSVQRTPAHFEHWIRWVLYTVGEFYKFRDDPVTAPRFTHSCNRYFRPCSMLPWCDSPEEEQREGLETMFVDLWDPLKGEGGGD